MSLGRLQQKIHERSGERIGRGATVVGENLWRAFNTKLRSWDYGINSGDPKKISE